MRNFHSENNVLDGQLKTDRRGQTIARGGHFVSRDRGNYSEESSTTNYRGQDPAPRSTTSQMGTRYFEYCRARLLALPTT